MVIVVFPAPVAPTIAMVSPSFTSKLMPCKISSPATYSKRTSSNLILPFTSFNSFSPPVSVSVSVSKIANTRSEAIMPICKVLNLSAICLIGRNNCCESCIKRKIFPKSYTLSPIICRPPNHTISAMVIDTHKSPIGKKIELYHIVFSHACLCFSFIFLKFSNSSRSCAKSCSTLIPEMRSCTKAFRFATW